MERDWRVSACRRTLAIAPRRTLGISTLPDLTSAAPPDLTFCGPFPPPPYSSPLPTLPSLPNPSPILLHPPSSSPLTIQLLRRFFSLLHAHNPELAGEKRRYTMVPPQVTREGTKKTMFANITDICRRMRRQPEHVIQFLYSELGTQGSIDGSQRLIMKGRYNQKQIENVLRKYIGEYSCFSNCMVCRVDG